MTKQITTVRAAHISIAVFFILYHHINSNIRTYSVNGLRTHVVYNHIYVVVVYTFVFLLTTYFPRILPTTHARVPQIKRTYNYINRFR